MDRTILGIGRNRPSQLYQDISVSDCSSDVDESDVTLVDNGSVGRYNRLECSTSHKNNKLFLQQNTCESDHNKDRRKRSVFDRLGSAPAEKKRNTSRNEPVVLDVTEDVYSKGNFQKNCETRHGTVNSWGNANSKLNSDKHFSGRGRCNNERYSHGSFNTGVDNSSNTFNSSYSHSTDIHTGNSSMAQQWRMSQHNVPPGFYARNPSNTQWNNMPNNWNFQNTQLNTFGRPWNSENSQNIPFQPTSLNHQLSGEWYQNNLQTMPFNFSNNNWNQRGGFYGGIQNAPTFCNNQWNFCSNNNRQIVRQNVPIRKLQTNISERNYGSDCHQKTQEDCMSVEEVTVDSTEEHIEGYLAKTPKGVTASYVVSLINSQLKAKLGYTGAPVKYGKFCSGYHVLQFTSKQLLNLVVKCVNPIKVNGNTLVTVMDVKPNLVSQKKEIIKELDKNKEDSLDEIIDLEPPSSDIPELKGGNKNWRGKNNKVKYHPRPRGVFPDAVQPETVVVVLDDTLPYIDIQALVTKGYRILTGTNLDVVGFIELIQSDESFKEDGVLYVVIPWLGFFLKYLNFYAMEPAATAEEIPSLNSIIQQQETLDQDVASLLNIVRDFAGQVNTFDLAVLCSESEISWQTVGGHSKDGSTNARGKGHSDRLYTAHIIAQRLLHNAMQLYSAVRLGSINSQVVFCGYPVHGVAAAAVKSAKNMQEQVSLQQVSELTSSVTTALHTFNQFAANTWRLGFTFKIPSFREPLSSASESNTDKEANVPEVEILSEIMTSSGHTPSRNRELPYCRRPVCGREAMNRRGSTQHSATSGIVTDVVTLVDEVATTSDKASLGKSSKRMSVDEDLHPGNAKRANTCISALGAVLGDHESAGDEELQVCKEVMCSDSVDESSATTHTNCSKNDSVQPLVVETHDVSKQLVNMHEDVAKNGSHITNLIKMNTDKEPNKTAVDRKKSKLRHSITSTAVTSEEGCHSPHLNSEDELFYEDVHDLQNSEEVDHVTEEPALYSLREEPETEDILAGNQHSSCEATEKTVSVNGTGAWEDEGTLPSPAGHSDPISDFELLDGNVPLAVPLSRLFQRPWQDVTCRLSPKRSPRRRELEVPRCGSRGDEHLTRWFMAKLLRLITNATQTLGQRVSLLPWLPPMGASPVGDAVPGLVRESLQAGVYQECVALGDEESPASYYCSACSCDLLDAAVADCHAHSPAHTAAVVRGVTGWRGEAAAVATLTGSQAVRGGCGLRQDYLDRLTRAQIVQLAPGSPLRYRCLCCGNKNVSYDAVGLRMHVCTAQHRAMVNVRLGLSKGRHVVLQHEHWSVVKGSLCRHPSLDVVILTDDMNYAVLRPLTALHRKVELYTYPNLLRDPAAREAAVTRWRSGSCGVGGRGVLWLLVMGVDLLITSADTEEKANVDQIMELVYATHSYLRLNLPFDHLVVTLPVLPLTILVQPLPPALSSSLMNGSNSITVSDCQVSSIERPYELLFRRSLSVHAANAAHHNVYSLSKSAVCVGVVRVLGPGKQGSSEGGDGDTAAASQHFMYSPWHAAVEGLTVAAIYGLPAPYLRRCQPLPSLPSSLTIGDLEETSRLSRAVVVGDIKFQSRSSGFARKRLTAHPRRLLFNALDLSFVLEHAKPAPPDDPVTWCLTWPVPPAVFVSAPNPCCVRNRCKRGLKEWVLKEGVEENMGEVLCGMRSFLTKLQSRLPRGNFANVFPVFPTNMIVFDDTDALTHDRIHHFHDSFSNTYFTRASADTLRHVARQLMRGWLQLLCSNDLGHNLAHFTEGESFGVSTATDDICTTNGAEDNTNGFCSLSVCSVSEEVEQLRVAVEGRGERWLEAVNAYLADFSYPETVELSPNAVPKSSATVVQKTCETSSPKETPAQKSLISELTVQNTNVVKTVKTTTMSEATVQKAGSTGRESTEQEPIPSIVLE